LGTIILPSISLYFSRPAMTALMGGAEPSKCVSCKPNASSPPRSTFFRKFHPGSVCCPNNVQTLTASEPCRTGSDLAEFNRKHKNLSIAPSYWKLLKSDAIQTLIAISVRIFCTLKTYGGIHSHVLSEGFISSWMSCSVKYLEYPRSVKKQNATTWCMIIATSQHL